MKTLTLVSLGRVKPPLEELERVEEADGAPRRSMYDRAMDTDLLDEKFLAAVPPFRRFLYRWFPGYVAQVIEAFIVRNRYDVIVSWAEQLGLLFAALLKVTGSHPLHYGIFYWVSIPKKAQLLKRVHTNFTRIFFMSMYQRDFAVNVLGVPPEKARFLPFHVDEKFWRPMPGKGDVIVTSGREWRDYPTLIRAVTGLDIPCHIAAKFIPGTKDAWVQEIEAMGPLPGNVSFGANETITEVRDWYARSRFIVIPVRESEAAVGTTVLLEAMAMGKAVILSGIKGHGAEALQEGKTGLFVKPGDVRALREAILHLWNNPDIAEKMGREGRHRVEEFHTMEKWVHTVKRDIENELVLRRRTWSHYQVSPSSE